MPSQVTKPSNARSAKKTESTSQLQQSQLQEKKNNPKVVSLKQSQNKRAKGTSTYVPSSEIEFSIEFLNHTKKDKTHSQSKLSLIAAALLSLSLPLSYIAFMALSTFGLMWHMETNVELLELTPQAFYAIFYYAPFVITPLILLFLLKPLFAKRVSRTGIKTISQKEQTTLYNFVNQLALQMGAPPPKEIRVSIEPEVKYSLVSSQSALITKQFALTIGLPLLEALNNRQLAALIAHEMAYYSSAKDTRLIWLVRSLRAWFWRSAYQPDVWDARVQQMQSTKSNKAMQVFSRELQTIIRLTKAINRWFFQLNEMTSQASLAALQKKADQVALQISGMEDFKKAESIRHVLYLAYEKNLRDYDFSWENTHPNLPAYFNQELLNFKKNKNTYQRAKLNGRLSTALNSWQQRLKALEATSIPSNLQVAYPALDLVNKYDVLGSECSDLFYHEFFAIPLSNKKQQNEDAETSQLQQYFGGLFVANRLIGSTLDPQKIAKGVNPNNVDAQSLNQAILILRSRLPDWRNANELWENTFKDYQEAIKQELKNNPQPQLDPIYATLGFRSDELKPIEYAFTQRLDQGLLLSLSRMEATEQTLLLAKINLSKTLSQQQLTVTQLCCEAVLLQQLLSELENTKEKYRHQTLTTVIKKHSSNCQRNLLALNKNIAPCLNSTTQEILPEHVFQQNKKGSSPLLVLENAKAILQQLFRANALLNTHFAQICLETEASLKLSPLKVMRIQNK